MYLIFSGKELIETLPKEVNLGMFELYCEDLIQNLYRKTGVLRESILRKMQQDHQVCSIINRNLILESIYIKLLINISKQMLLNLTIIKIGWEQATVCKVWRSFKYSLIQSQQYRGACKIEAKCFTYSNRCDCGAGKYYLISENGLLYEIKWWYHSYKLSPQSLF